MHACIASPYLGSADSAAVSHVYSLTWSGILVDTSAHKMAEGPAKRLFGNIVKMFEAIGTVGPDETLGAAAERILGPQYEASEECSGV